MNPKGRRGLIVTALSLALVAPRCTAETVGQPEKSSAAAGGQSDKTVAAAIGDQKITLQDLDDYLKKTNPRAFQELYEARRAALEALISERLVAAEAASKGIAADKMQQDVVASAGAVTDADVSTFYDQNKARMGARTLDDTKEQIRSYLASQKQQKALSDFLSGLKAKSHVEVFLEPPRAEVKIADNDPYKGPKTAPVQIVEFSDFQ